MKLLKKIFAFLTILTVLTLPVFVSAQTTCDSNGLPAGCIPGGTTASPASAAPQQQTGSGVPIQTGSGAPPVVSSIVIHNPFDCGLQNNDQCDLPSLIKTILNNIIMPIASVAVVIYIVWAGFQFLVAQGNEKKITEAKSRLLWALIGAGILLGADAIANVVANTITALITTHP